MDVRIKACDKINIYFRTAVKLFRGCFKRLFLKVSCPFTLIAPLKPVYKPVKRVTACT